jgi:hypothetical protein
MPTRARAGRRVVRSWTGHPTSEGRLRPLVLKLSGGLVVDLGGSFAAGVDGAHPGIIMKAHPAVGDFYRQEFLLNEAEDLAEVLSLSESVTVPAGSFDHCLKTKETEAIDPSALENKFYAAGIGNVLTHDLVTGEMLPLVMIKTQ